MAGDGTDFTIDIETQAAGVEPAALAVARLAKSLTESSEAAKQAAEAVRVGQAAYQQAESAATRAAVAVEKIGIAAEAQRGKLAAALQAGDTTAAERATKVLASLTVREAEAAEKARLATEAMNAQAVSLDKLKAAAAGAADAEKKVAKSHELAKKAADDTAAAAKKAAGSGDVGKIEGALGKLGGPLGAVGQKAFGAADAFKKMGESLGSAGPYVAIAVAIVAIATAALAATVAVGAWAVGLADAARTQQLLSDGIAGTVAGGRELDATIEGLATKVPQTREELLGMAGTLAKTGLKGAELSKALEDAATKAAKLKWGPNFQKQTLSLASQATRLKANIAGVFGGLNIEPLLENIAKLVALFDSTSSSGKAMKFLFETMFQPLIDGVAAAIPTAIRYFIQFEIMLLKAAIFLKPYSAQVILIAEAFVVLGALVVGAFVVVLAALAGAVAAIALVIAATLALGSMFESLGVQLRLFGQSVVEGAGAAFDSFVAKVDAVRAFLSTLSFAEIGASLIQGLVDGITSGGGAVLAAITGVADGAIGAAKAALGIASPSKVFAEIGENTAAGMAGGVEGGSGDVSGAMTDMVAPPAAPAATASASGGGHTFQITITAPSGDAEAIGTVVRRVLLDVLEGEALQLGAGAPA